jgi:hypothetical protein
MKKSRNIDSQRYGSECDPLQKRPASGYFWVIKTFRVEFTYTCTGALRAEDIPKDVSELKEALGGILVALATTYAMEFSSAVAWQKISVLSSLRCTTNLLEELTSTINFLHTIMSYERRCITGRHSYVTLSISSL